MEVTSQERGPARQNKVQKGENQNTNADFNVNRASQAGLGVQSLNASSPRRSSYLVTAFPIPVWYGPAPGEEETEKTPVLTGKVVSGEPGSSWKIAGGGTNWTGDEEVRAPGQTAVDKLVPWRATPPPPSARGLITTGNNRQYSQSWFQYIPPEGE